jgi:hypothetical protein
VDPYFNSFRILHASAFSLSLKTDGQSFEFDPVLFGRRVVDRGNSETCPVSEAESLLTEHQHQVFSDQRFRSSELAKSSYVIERGIYVHLDPSLRDGLTVVRRMQLSDPETRKRFAQKPQLYLKEALSGSLSDDEIERLFVETEQYSARVVDIGVWNPPVLPWIKKDPNDWLPEKFGLQINGQYVVVAPDEIGALRERISAARAKGEPFIEVGKDKTRIPATAEAEEAICRLMSEVRPTASPRGPEQIVAKGNGESHDGKRVLIVEENFETLGFTRKLTPRAGINAGQPSAVRSSLKKHQNSGLAWVQEAWLLGLPGSLLADDMGLGKTLQALAFLAWLREIKSADRGFGGFAGPILIVAPTGLLLNWEKEHELHLHEPGLGGLCGAYGRHLKSLKTTNGSDGNGSFPTLDQQRMRTSDWVVTTYETLRDYHTSFAAIPFVCAVFDEMQKVKSPASLLTRAAKTVNANVIFGLTGTPIENQLADLWCIMDIIYPGYLGDLKSFSSEYEPENHAALEKLRSMLMERTADLPPPLLRRMKMDQLDLHLWDKSVGQGCYRRTSQCTKSCVSCILTN